jgi:hypothetical protein
MIPSIKNPTDVAISVGEYPSIKTTNRLRQPANVLVIANPTHSWLEIPLDSDEEYNSSREKN